MMSESEMIRFIRQVIREEFASVAMAQVVSNADQLRTTFQRSTTSPPFSGSRNIQPYGVSSRAPANTPCLTVPVGNNPTNVNMVGVHDPSKPAVDDGETMIYNEFGQAVYLKNGSVHLGTSAASHPVSLGDSLQSILSKFLGYYIANAPEGNLGYPIGPPSNMSDAQTLKASPVDDGTMNSSIVFTG